MYVRVFRAPLLLLARYQGVFCDFAREIARADFNLRNLHGIKSTKKVISPHLTYSELV